MYLLGQDINFCLKYFGVSNSPSKTTQNTKKIRGTYAIAEAITKIDRCKYSSDGHFINAVIKRSKQTKLVAERVYRLMQENGYNRESGETIKNETNESVTI